MRKNVRKTFSVEKLQSWLVQRIARVDWPCQKPPQQKRIERLQGMILSGGPNTACLAYARHTWGVSRAQGYKLIKRAWQQIKNDIDASGIDRQELLSWSIQTLMAAAGHAMKQKNPGRSLKSRQITTPRRASVLFENMRQTCTGSLETMLLNWPGSFTTPLES